MMERFARGVISSFSPVSIFDTDVFGVLFASASPMRISVKEAKRATKFQVESGEIRSDHIVDLPIEMSIDFMIAGNEARSHFANLQQKFHAKEPVYIQSRLTTYENMLIVEISREEASNISDGSTMTVRFEEWREIQPEYGELSQKSVLEPKHSDTVQRGRIETVPANEKKGSWIYGKMEGTGVFDHTNK